MGGAPPAPLAVLVALTLSCASAARVVSEGVRIESTADQRAMEVATARRDAKFKHFKATRDRREQDDDCGEAKQPVTPKAREANFAEIKSMLLEAEAFDKWQLRRQGLLPASEEEDKRLLQHFGDDDPEAFCKSNKYRKKTMKPIKDSPFIGLFNDLRNITRFEGSSITYAKGSYWVVYDSLRTIGRVGLQFQFRGPENLLIPEDAEEVESQFEGLQYMPSTDSFLAVRESIDHEQHGLVPLTEEIKVNKDSTHWTVHDVCPVKFYELEDTNKGWEGLHYFEQGKDRYLLGLCESNYCKTILGPDPPGLQRGNGRLILTKYVKGSKNLNDTDTCHWEVLKEIKLPPEAYFLDYAGIAFWPHPFGRDVTIVSQEDAAVFLGSFNWDIMEFEEGGTVYHFPRNDACKKTYCNVEGLTFLDRRRMLFASDRTKLTQSYECAGHDQSVHIMALP